VKFDLKGGKRKTDSEECPGGGKTGHRGVRRGTRQKKRRRQPSTDGPSEREKGEWVAWGMQRGLLGEGHPGEEPLGDQQGGALPVERLGEIYGSPASFTYGYPGCLQGKKNRSGERAG